MPAERTAEVELERQRKMQVILDQEKGNHQSLHKPTMQERIEGARAIINYQINVRAPIIQANFRKIQIEEEERLAEAEKELQEYLIRLREESNTFSPGQRDIVLKTLKKIAKDQIRYRRTNDDITRNIVVSELDEKPEIHRKKNNGWGPWKNMTKKEFNAHVREFMANSEFQKAEEEDGKDDN